MPRWETNSVAPVDPSRSRGTGDDSDHHVHGDEDHDEEYDEDSASKDENHDNYIENYQDGTKSKLGSMDTGIIQNDNN